MIDWQETQKKFGHSSVDGLGFRSKVVCACDGCNAIKSVTVRVKSRIIDNQMRWECPRCVGKRQEVRDKLKATTLNSWKKPEYKEAQRTISKRLWADPEYRARLISSEKRHYSDTKIKSALSEKYGKLYDDKAYKERQKTRSLELWKNPEFRKKCLAKSDLKTNASHDPSVKSPTPASILSIFKSVEFRTKASRSSKLMWSDPVKRSHMISLAVARWKNPSYRARMLESLNKEAVKAKLAEARSRMPKISSIQRILYSILDDLGVSYKREVPIGPWTFDCAVERSGKPTLLIECQGDYWHKLDGKPQRDLAKVSYVNNNFPGQYEVKQIWEHEFYNKNKISELLKYWLGITRYELVDFKFDDIEIRESEQADYAKLLTKYHYLSNAGRGGMAYGAYLQDELIAVVVFSPLIRQNIDKSISCKADEARELSRLCIHPRYQKKNLASWFVTRCIKLLPQKYKVIISYCDTTFNHDGATYKACNFKLDKVVEPDYWYVSDDGWVMHKRTLYGHAVKMQMAESQFAKLYSYHKVLGQSKLRFKFVR
jgi:GNAT superfamily N-acetyltransferase